MKDPELIGLPGHEVMRIGPPVSADELIARDKAILAELYTSTDYEDCYLDIGEFDALAGTGKTCGQFAYLMHWTEKYISRYTRPHNRAHANKIARHAKRPNGRPRFR